MDKKNHYQLIRGACCFLFESMNQPLVVCGCTLISLLFLLQ